MRAWLRARAAAAWSNDESLGREARTVDEHAAQQVTAQHEVTVRIGSGFASAAASRDGIELSARERQTLVTWYEAAVKR